MFKNRIVRISILAAALIACGALMHLSGPAGFVFVYNFYFVILLAAHWYAIPGGALTGAGAGIAASSYFLTFAPDDYSLSMWLIRIAYFVAIGSVAGLMRVQVTDRRNLAEANVISLSRTYARTLKALTGLLEGHDEETAGHCERVALNAIRVGERMRLSPQELAVLYWASYLHDIGKLATPAAILLKKGSLTSAEYDVMKTHAAVGADTILSINADFGGIADAIRSHHERWDGTGYPLGLAGDKIPLLGRIIAVVDAFEAMTSDRPYKAARTSERASLILQEEAGAQFDADIVKHHLALLAEGRLHTQALYGAHTGLGLPEFFNPVSLDYAFE